MRYTLFIIALVSLFLSAFAQSEPEFTHPSILSFESSTQGFVASKGASVSLSGDHYKHGHHALRWSWTQPNASIRLSGQDIRWTPDPKDAPDPSTYTFAFWVYAAKPLRGAKLTFEFMKAGKRCSWFDFGLDFQGWRGAWVAYKRDMQGVPVDGMDELRITVSNAPKGAVYLDHLILSSLQDMRQHTADTQAPFINAETNSH